MSIEIISEHLDDLLKIPMNQQDPATLKQLQDYRKKLADEFYHKTGEKFDTPFDRKMTIYGPLSKLHNYFGYKPINKPFPPGKGKRVVSENERITNCEAFTHYLSTCSPGLTPEMIVALSNVWGSP